MLLPLPKSEAEIGAIQRLKKREAFEKARRTKLLGPRLSHIDAGKIDDPAEWRKIPILTKEELRTLSPAQFNDQFCLLPREDIVEVWRSDRKSVV